MVDVLGALVDIVLLSKNVTNVVSTRVFKASAAQIGEGQYPCVTIERRSPGSFDEAAPIGDFDILVCSHAFTTDLAWSLHHSVQLAIGRAYFAAGPVKCAVLPGSTPFDIPPDDHAQLIYTVAQLYRVRTFGE